ncbi:hypothetical protein CEUSTIGMA_g2880.t1 [Chlamydomonas eustigma]|uniref:Proton pump-interactor 1 n=1 Tax=Chlamydomonas eustigma TaxID=1157962 RepID=A0A250WXC3_9CHLO|nr:hypothetical protein CEUSTIGMA_g2880.t1 [Chlamydomonas eustigma]|eukprot:GAX75436.1 hypothetical protein CEUSTIGMA_g2880.t1 [Chlamydomonas eustigma]
MNISVSTGASLKVDMDEFADRVAEEKVADVVDTNGHAEQESEAAKKLYFVRLPRPHVDDGLLKRLQQEFQSHVAEIKAINTRLASKRDVVKELRKQMTQAKSLKDSSQPEFEEKLSRLRQLRDLRSGYLDKISAIRNSVKGLECDTEEKLDEKISELEDKIRFGGILLREEKMVVNEISKLRNQREKIKEFELDKASLSELEAESKKIKAVIDEMDGEFSIIKGERDVASGILKDFWNQLKAAEAAASKVEEEQKEAVERKNEALEALEAARREVDGSMGEYRENRKFSLAVRDLLAAGRVEEAQEMCHAQVNQLVGKFSSDSVFRSEYNKAWAEQRRYAVSELLPESSNAAMAAAAAKQPAQAKAGKGAAKSSVPAEKLVPRGAEKAKDIISALLMQASTEAARVKSNAPVEADYDEYDEPEALPEPVPKASTGASTAPPAVATKPAVAPKLVTNPAAKAAEVFNVKVDLPVIKAVEFVPPVIRAEVETVSKDKVREEQRLKALEAEQRKKKKLEVAEKKKAKAIELSKKSDEEERAGKALRAQQLQAKAVVPAVVPQVEEEEVAEVTQGGSEVTAVSAHHHGVGKPSPSLNASALKPPATAVRRPVGKGNLLKKLKKVYQQNQVVIAVCAVIALILFILIAASFY